MAEESSPPQESLHRDIPKVTSILELEPLHTTCRWSCSAATAWGEDHSAPERALLLTINGIAGSMGNRQHRLSRRRQA